MDNLQKPTGMTVAPFAKMMYVMAKPAGARCNLNCRYCYYLEKSSLTGGSGDMDDELLEKFVREYVAAQTTPEVLFIWHGGEPMLRGLDFYRKALKLQRRYAGGRAVDNSIQTNGTLINDDWCRFFRDNGFLVGVSIDGPEAVHDRLRKNRAGAPTFRRVMRGIELLDRYGVQWNAMATVNSANVIAPEEFYDFFKSIGCRYLQFTPVVERAIKLQDGRERLASPSDRAAMPAPDSITPTGISPNPMTPAGISPNPIAQTDISPNHMTPVGITQDSITPEQWGDFLCRVFDRWWPSDVGKQFVQIFDATLANWMGQPPGICTMARECGHAGVLEHNGDLYSCDHFVFPEYRLGNIWENTLVEMMYSPRQQHFGTAKSSSLPRQCRECEFLFACNGECPKNRFALTEDGEAGLNWLCGGYRRFFAHSAPAMTRMRDRLLRG